MPGSYIVLTVCLVCAGIVSQATAQSPPAANQSPTTNPPQILIASEIDADGQLVLVTYKTIYIGFTGESYNSRSTSKVPLDGVKIMTADGKERTLKEARKQISKKDTPILASSYNATLPKFYATMFAPATLHFVFPKRAPKWKQIQEPSSPLRK